MVWSIDPDSLRMLHIKPSTVKFGELDLQGPTKNVSVMKSQS